MIKLHTLSFLITFFACKAFALSPIVPRTLATTEGSYQASGTCQDCEVQESALMSFLKNTPAYQQGWFEIEEAAYFDDGNDRESIMDLRRRAESNPSSITDEEAAILRAANRTGYIRWPDCGIGGNAFLVNINGRDAIVTSAHIALDTQSGTPRKNCTDEQLKNAVYLPDASYMDGLNGSSEENKNSKRQVPVTLGNDNTQLNDGVAILVPNDWIILYPEDAKTISRETALDGQVRGSIEFSTLRTKDQQTVYNIGFNPKFKNDHNQGKTISSYQTCKSQTPTASLAYVSCDVVRGSSGSLVATMENGELVFSGIMSANSSSYDESKEHPLPMFSYDWNIATPSSQITKALGQ